MEACPPRLSPAEPRCHPCACPGREQGHFGCCQPPGRGSTQGCLCPHQTPRLRCLVSCSLCVVQTCSYVREEHQKSSNMLGKWYIKTFHIPWGCNRLREGALLSSGEADRAGHSWVQSAGWAGGSGAADFISLWGFKGKSHPWLLTERDKMGPGGWVAMSSGDHSPLGCIRTSNTSPLREGALPRPPWSLNTPRALEA